MKTHFAIKDNVLDKVLATMIEEKHFVKRQNVNKLTHEIKEVVASFYTNNDLKLAEKMLEGEVNQISRKDLCQIAFLSGSIIVFVMSLAFAMVLQKDKFEHKESFVWAAIEAQNTSMRLCFIVCYILFATGFCIQVFREFHINYLHIF